MVRTEGSSEFASSIVKSFMGFGEKFKDESLFKQLPRRSLFY